MGRARIGILKRSARNQNGFLKMRITMEQACDLMDLSISENVMVVAKYRRFASVKTSHDDIEVDRFKTTDEEDDLILHIQDLNRKMATVKNKLRKILIEGEINA